MISVWTRVGTVGVPLLTAGFLGRWHARIGWSTLLRWLLLVFTDPFGVVDACTNAGRTMDGRTMRTRAESCAGSGRVKTPPKKQRIPEIRVRPWQCAMRPMHRGRTFRGTSGATGHCGRLVQCIASSGAQGWEPQAKI